MGHEAFSASDVTVILKTPSKDALTTLVLRRATPLRGQGQGGWFERASRASRWMSCRMSAWQLLVLPF